MFWHDLWWFVLSKRPENFDSYKIDTFFLCLQPSPLSHTSTSPSTFVFNNHLKFLSLRQASDHALVKILSQPKRHELMRSKRESLGPVRVELVPSTAEHSPPGMVHDACSSPSIASSRLVPTRLRHTRQPSLRYMLQDIPRPSSSTGFLYANIRKVHFSWTSFVWVDHSAFSVCLSCSSQICLAFVCYHFKFSLDESLETSRRLLYRMLVDSKW